MEDLLVHEHERLDDLILGDMKIIQPRQGYRFSIDAVLVAFFPRLERVGQVVDLGTGSGVIPLLLAYRNQNIRITGLEIGEAAVQRARRSAEYNRLSKRITILQGDIKNIGGLLPPGEADLVVSNPPFWKKGEGRVSKDPEQALARHELEIDLPGIITAAAYLLKAGGSLNMIHRADRREEILSHLSRHGFNQIRIRRVQSFPDRQSHLLLVEGRKGPYMELLEMEPLIIYQQAGEYSEEIKGIYGMSPNLIC